MTEKKFLELINQIGVFTGSRKYNVHQCDSDYDYVINNKDLSLFKSILWDSYITYHWTPFKTMAYYININKNNYNIITYPDDFDLKIIHEVNDEMINSNEHIIDKKTRINLFEKLIKEKYNK